MERKRTRPADPDRRDRPQPGFAPGTEGRDGGDDRLGGQPPPSGRLVDPSVLLVLLEAVRRALPRELEQQLNALLREFLLTVRALIDWYLERLDGRPREPEVEDIPID